MQEVDKLNRGYASMWRRLWRRRTYATRAGDSQSSSSSTPAIRKFSAGVRVTAAGR